MIIARGHWPWIKSLLASPQLPVIDGESTNRI